MNSSRSISSVTVAAVLAVAGAVTAQAPGMPSSEMNKGLAPEVQEKMDLTDAQVKGFFDASDDLRAAGEKANAGGKPASDPAAFAKGLALSQESVAIIEKHGFKDATEFQRVGYNAAMAYSVLKQGGKEAVKAKLDKAEVQQKQTMERLKATLSPDQFKLFESQAGMALANARTMQDVPEGNIEIMKKYQSRMEHLGKK